MVHVWGAARRAERDREAAGRAPARKHEPSAHRWLCLRSLIVAVLHVRSPMRRMLRYDPETRDAVPPAGPRRRALAACLNEWVKTWYERGHLPVRARPLAHRRRHQHELLGPATHASSMLTCLPLLVDVHRGVARGQTRLVCRPLGGAGAASVGRAPRDCQQRTTWRARLATSRGGRGSSCTAVSCERTTRPRTPRPRTSADQREIGGSIRIFIE